MRQSIKIIKIKRDTLTFGTRLFSLVLKIRILNKFFYILTEHIYASLPMVKLILHHPPYSIKYWSYEFSVKQYLNSERFLNNEICSTVYIKLSLLMAYKTCIDNV